MAVALSENSRMLVFPAEELKELGRGRGIKLMGLDDKEKLVAVGFSGKDSVTVSGISPRADKEKTVTLEGEDLQKYVLRRARKGRLLPGKLKPTGVASDAVTK
jgi:topoisomerase-4 subunit A